jgi:RecA-family ATPase
MDTQDQGAAIQPFDFQTMEQLIEAPPEDTHYVVDDLLPSAGTSLLLAKPKTGKSTLARQLAVAVAQGGTILGRSVEQGRVLYLCLEEIASEVLAHLRMLGADKGDPIHSLFGAVNKRTAIAQLNATLKHFGDVRLVIIDPLFRFLPVEDSSNYVEVNDWTERLSELAKKYGAHVMALHHLKKRIEEDSMDQTLGSTAINGAVDTILMLIRDKNGVRMLSSTQRYGASIPATYLAWDEESKSVALGNSREEAQQYDQTQKERGLESQILDYIREHGACANDAIKVSGKRQKIIAALKQLAADGKLTISGSGKRGDPTVYAIAPVPTVSMPVGKKETVN